MACENVWALTSRIREMEENQEMTGVIGVKQIYTNQEKERCRPI